MAEAAAHIDLIAHYAHRDRGDLADGNIAMHQALAQAVHLVDRMGEAKPDPGKWPEWLATLRRVLRGGLAVREGIQDERDARASELDVQAGELVKELRRYEAVWGELPSIAPHWEEAPGYKTGRVILHANRAADLVEVLVGRIAELEARLATRKATPETVERLARALCVSNGNDPDARCSPDGTLWWQTYVDDAALAINFMGTR